MVTRSALLVLLSAALAMPLSAAAPADGALDEIPADERNLDRFADSRIEEAGVPILVDEEETPEEPQSSPQAVVPSPTPAPVVAEPEPEPEPSPTVKRKRRTLGNTKPIRRRR